MGGRAWGRLRFGVMAAMSLTVILLALSPTRVIAAGIWPQAVGGGLVAQASGTRGDFVNVVSSQSPGSSSHTYLNWWNGNSSSPDWCCIFVAYCANQAGVPYEVIPQKPASSLQTGSGWKSTVQVTGLRDYMVNHGGAWHDYSYTPRAGDIIVFNNDTDYNDLEHVGVVLSVSGGRVYTREGNTGNGVGGRYFSVGSHTTGDGGNTRYVIGFVSPNFPPDVDPNVITDFNHGSNVALPEGDGIYTIAFAGNP